MSICFFSSVRDLLLEGGGAEDEEGADEEEEEDMSTTWKKVVRLPVKQQYDAFRGFWFLF